MKYRLAAVALLLLVAYWSGLAGLWTADREPGSRNRSIEVMTPEVQAGGDLLVRYNVDRARRCRVKIERVFVDATGIRFILEDQDFAASPGPLGDDSYVVRTKVPMAAHPGEARYRVVVSYYCNPLHSIVNWPVVDVLPDARFTVVTP